MVGSINFPEIEAGSILRARYEDFNGFDRLENFERAPHVRISGVEEIKLSADELVSSLLSLGEHEPAYILDSCGVGHLGSHLLIAGLRPVDVFEIERDDPAAALDLLDEKLASGHAAVFTLSYDFGMALQLGSPRQRRLGLNEPDLHLALFDFLIVHDYD
ncbi:MAG TPA: hypothetical protein VMZ26_13290, partial [Pyrinomonadaceae bacterium]|nr:hypothetical protein [Pyrinomonadaceae bacterium]